MIIFVFLSFVPLFVEGQFAGYTGPCAQSRGGVRIGDLPTLAHNVSGVLWLEHPGRFCIENFWYDGQGPDTFIYFFYSGDEVRQDGGGYTVVLNDQRAQFTKMPYRGATFRFALPERTPVACDFGYFTVWCRSASLFFTKLAINSTIFGETNINRTSIACSQSPGRAFMGVLPTLFHQVSGELFVRDNKTIIIRNFNYDGLGPDAFVYWYPVGKKPNELGNGEIIPLGDPNDREGAFPVGAQYRFMNELFTITIPDDMDVYTCDIGTFTIWCRQFTQWFTSLEFDTSLFTNNLRVKEYEPSKIYCNRKSTRPGMYVGELPMDVATHAVSGFLYVVNENELYIQLFDYMRGECTDAYFYFYVDGQTVSGSGGGYTVNYNQSQETLPDFIINADIHVDIRYARARTCDVKYFTVWCESSQMHLTSIEIPDNIFTDSITSSDRIFCEKRLTAGSSPMVSSVTYVYAALLASAVYTFKP